MTLPPLADLGNADHAEFARSFLAHIDARVAVLTDEINTLTDLRARVAEWQTRLEVTSDANAT